MCSASYIRYDQELLVLKLVMLCVTACYFFIFFHFVDYFRITILRTLCIMCIFHYFFFSYLCTSCTISILNN